MNSFFELILVVGVIVGGIWWSTRHGFMHGGRYERDRSVVPDLSGFGPTVNDSAHPPVGTSTPVEYKLTDNGPQVNNPYPSGWQQGNGKH